MARKAGSLVLDRLRDRILVGRYFGCWSPGDRLPSVRDVARIEAVDRKTAAAAYRRLQREGLVRIEARSGVYLGGDPSAGGGDPLRRLHEQWLESALATANDLGLTVDRIVRMFQAVARVQSHRVAVVDQDPEHASLLARELTTRTGLQYMSCEPADLPAPTGPLRATPFVVATPIAARALDALRGRFPVVQATLAPSLLARVATAAVNGPTLVIVGTEGLRRELERAAKHGLAGTTHHLHITRSLRPGGRVAARDGAGAPFRVILWPGAPPPSTLDTDGGEMEDMHRADLLSAATVTRIRAQLARTALDQLSSSSAF